MKYIERVKSLSNYTIFDNMNFYDLIYDYKVFLIIELNN
jgi:hypothetical protein